MRGRRFVPPPAVLLPALLSGALFFLAFPPFATAFPAALLCLVPLAVAARRMADAGCPTRDGVRLGWWFGIVGYGASIYWIAIALSIYSKLAILGYLGALFVMTALTGGAVGTLVAARRATRWPLAILLPITWVAWEKLTEWLPQLGFPWLPLGLATARLHVLAQSVDVSGVHGASFWIVVVNGLLADAWLPGGAPRHRRASWARAALPVVAIVAGVAVYGRWREETIALRPLAPIAVVQPNVPQEEKWQGQNRDRIVGMLASATREAVAHHDAKLVVWPEVALPGWIGEHPEWRDTLRALGGAGHTPILFGVIDVQWYPPTPPSYQPDYDYFNAAMLTDSLGGLGDHPSTRKQYLVPVVERVPFLNPRWFGSLKYFGGYGRGSGATVYREPWGAFGVLICYESIFPSQARALRRNGADVLLNITNDAWFGRSTAPWQHESHMRLRAIETRAAVVRSANTGISSFIDPLGREHGATGLFVPAVRRYDVQTSDARSPYLALGDWVGWGSVAASALLALYAAVRRRRERARLMASSATTSPAAR